jgi:GTP cyclohydrolase II
MEEYQIKNPLREDETDVKQMLKQLEIESMERMKKINNAEYDNLNDYFKEIDKILENGRNEFFRVIGRKMTFQEERVTFG